MNLTQRVKLAQELHDGIAQDLVGLGYGIDPLVSTEENEDKRAHMRSLRFEINELLNKVRAEILELRESRDESPPLNSQSGLQEILAKTINEIISNTLHHSSATRLRVTIEDNGVGGAHEKSNHFGLQGICERIELLNGELETTSDSTGTHTTFTIPLLTP